MTDVLVGSPVADVIEQFKKQEQHVTYHQFNRVNLNKDTIDFSFVDDKIHSAPVTDKYWLNYFCGVADIPFDYLETLDDSMKVELVNYHMPDIPQDRFHSGMSQVLIRDDRDNSFGVVPTLRRHASPSRLLTMYSEYFEGESTVVHYSTEIDHPRFSILNDRWNMTFLNDKDVAYFGLSVEWGQKMNAPRVFASSHRRVCGNVMNVPRNIGRVNTNFKLVNEANVVNRFNVAGHKAVGYVNNVLIPQLTNSTTKTFGELVKFLDQMSMSDRTRQIIMEAFLQEEGNTIYHVIQACTYASTHFDLTEKEMASLDKVVAFLLDLSDSSDTCQLCHHEM
jgi:hypothetical protein